MLSDEDQKVLSFFLDGSHAVSSLPAWIDRKRLRPLINSNHLSLITAPYTDDWISCLELTPKGRDALAQYAAAVQSAEQAAREKAQEVAQKAAEKAQEKASKRRQAVLSVALVVLGALLRELFGLVDWQALFSAIAKLFTP